MCLTCEPAVQGQVVDCELVMEGGTLAGVTIRSLGVAVDGDEVGSLRSWSPRAIAGLVRGCTVCDPHTFLTDQDRFVAAALSGR